MYHIINYIRGDATKAKEELGWEPKIRFRELVKEMVEADLKRLEKSQPIYLI